MSSYDFLYKNSLPTISLEALYPFKKLSTQKLRQNLMKQQKFKTNVEKKGKLIKKTFIKLHK